MKNIIVVILLIIGYITVTSCRRDPFEPHNTGSMEELRVPTDFDWKTSKDYYLSLIVSTEGIVEVSSKSSILYYRAYLKPGISNEIKLTLPGFEKVIILKFQDKTAELILKNSNLTYQFN